MNNMIKYLTYGSLFAISITSPSQFLSVYIFDLADLSLILLFSMITLEVFHTSETINWDGIIKSYWFYLVAVLSFTFLIYGLNSITVRFIFYTVFGFLIYYLFGKSSRNNIEIFFIPIWGISILNLLVAIFELSYLNNTLGWISFFYENPGFFNRGRLAGFQGGGPNVAGLLFTFLTFSSLYFYKLKNNLFYLILSFVKVFLVSITFSSGSYLALFVS